ncbi:MAG: serine acetyltransferase [Deltaproteobacteria bacterium]|nr:serine acetyltransferase [Deltaproteobacteria bacterium]
MVSVPMPDQCKKEIETKRHFRERIPSVVEALITTCGREDCFDHVGPEPIPSRDAVIDMVHRLNRILYPGYFLSTKLDEYNLHYYLGKESIELYEVLSEQITLSLRHDCVRHKLPCVHCEELGTELAARFMGRLPDLRIILATDVRAAYEGDPAAKGFDEIIFSYPGLFAVTVHRMAHELYELEVPFIPRIMSEYAHSLTGIDIHPGARIGEGFFIDHGTGVVIGETTVIGRGVRIYQGVTLGALSLPRGAGELLRNRKRHPTIQDEVIIYAGATILGGETTIGAGSVIGGNVWITESVPPGTRVFLKKPELIFKGS